MNIWNGVRFFYVAVSVCVCPQCATNQDTEPLHILNEKCLVVKHWYFAYKLIALNSPENNRISLNCVVMFVLKKHRTTFYATLLLTHGCFKLT